MPRPKAGATQDNVLLGLTDKGHTIKVFVVCNSWNVSAFRPSMRYESYWKELYQTKANTLCNLYLIYSGCVFASRGILAFRGL